MNDAITDGVKTNLKKKQLYFIQIFIYYYNLMYKINRIDIVVVTIILL